VRRGGADVVAVVPDILVAATKSLPTAHRTIRVADLHERKAVDAGVKLPKSAV
jgi:hypothetical protein